MSLQHLSLEMPLLFLSYMKLFWAIVDEQSIRGKFKYEEREKFVRTHKNTSIHQCNLLEIINSSEIFGLNSKNFSTSN